ncbi:MAG: DUF58 domain-containing protein [Emergencia sp.]
MTGAGLYLLWLLFLGAVCFFHLSWFLLGLMTLSILALPLSAAVLYREREKVKVSLQVQGSSEGRNTVKCRVTFRYGGVLPYVFCSLKLTFANRLTGESRQIRCRTVCGRKQGGELCLQAESRFCGKGEVTAEDLHIAGPLGIPYVRGLCRERKAALMLPAVREIPSAGSLTAAVDIEGVDYSGEKPGFDPSEIFAVREYREGDSLRSIHWKLSGKLDDLLVREPGLPVKNSMQLLMETCFSGPDEETCRSTMDQVAAWTISLSEQLIDSGISHRLGWMNYRENVFHNYEIENAADLMGILGELLAAGVIRGESRVEDKFREEQTGQQPGLMVIDYDTVQQLADKN